LIKAVESVRLPVDFVEMRVDDFVELGDILRSEVGHAVIFEVLPERFHRVQLGSIGWKSFEPQPGKPAEQFADGFTFVHGATVPNNNDLTPQVSQKRTHKFSGALAVDVLLGVTPKKQRESVSARRQA
jgi:hypothetical protein